jgi:hypothetical protein
MTVGWHLANTFTMVTGGGMVEARFEISLGIRRKPLRFPVLGTWQFRKPALDFKYFVLIFYLEMFYKNRKKSIKNRGPQ